MGSLAAMAITFQSSSPSSIMAYTPTGFTAVTLPIASAAPPISTTSRG